MIICQEVPNIPIFILLDNKRKSKLQISDWVEISLRTRQLEDL